MAVTIKLKQTQIARAECVLAAGKYESISAAKRRTGADIIFNAPIYDMDSKRIIRSPFDVFGEQHGDYSSWGLAMWQDGRIAWDYDNGAKADCFCGAYSHLLNDGKINDGLRDRAKKGRTALGMTVGGELVVCVAEQESADMLSTDELARKMLNLGCVNAINLDGSYSSQIMSPQGNIQTTRPVAGFVAIWLKKEEEKPTVKYDVCLDAGHGAETPGKRSPDGTYREFEFNRDVTAKIKAHLERCGLSVFLTAPGSEDVTLAQRCKLANLSGSKIVVSIHSNASGESWSDANYWLAGICAKGGNAEKLGRAIEAASAPLGMKSNGVTVQNWAMVRDTNAPAVLIEHGFHTNREHVAKLKMQEYRALIAECDARGICKYFGMKWVDEPSAGNWYDAEMAWAKANGIMDGTRPNDTATRAEVVAMIHRTVGK